VEFLDRNRKGMSSTFLTRLRIGEILVDAKGVSRLYHPRPGLAPLLVVIEVISYLSRVISLSVRLFANMMAGHVMLEVFGAFIIMLGGLGVLGYLPAALSLGLNTILIGFELLVATLQAYVFAVLTCIYLHDAVHLH